MSKSMKILTSMMTGSFGSFSRLNDHEKFPKVQGLMEYANKCYANGKAKDAVKEYHEAIRMHECIELYNNLALIHYSEKKPEKARVAFEQALELNPQSMLIKYNLGHFFYVNRRIDKAISIFKEIVERAEKQEKISDEDKVWVAFAHNDLGCAWYRKEEKEKAIEMFKKALEIEPSFLSAQNNLANVYCSQKKLDESLAEYEKIIEKDPKFAEALNGIGVVYFEKDEIKKAAEYFKKAYDTDPYCQVAMMNLQTLYVMAQRHAQHVAQQTEEIKKEGAEKKAEDSAEAPAE